MQIEIAKLSRKELMAIIFHLRWGIGSREKQPENMTRRELLDCVQALIRKGSADR